MPPCAGLSAADRHNGDTPWVMTTNQIGMFYLCSRACLWPGTQSRVWRLIG